MFFLSWALFFYNSSSSFIIDVLTLCLILGRRPCRLLLVTRFILSSIYLFIFLFLLNKFIHDWDWLRVWFWPSFYVMNKVPFESLRFKRDSTGFLFWFRVVLRLSISLDRLCNDRKELVTNPSSSILLALFSLKLGMILSSNLFSFK